MINGRCSTNLDEGRRYKWPTMFVAVPEIGQLVQAIDGPIRLYKLRVCSITHVQVSVPTKYNPMNEEPQIIVELTGYMPPLPKASPSHAE